MTTLAQLHDCHSCNDERSIDKKNSRLMAPYPSIARVSWRLRDFTEKESFTFQVGRCVKNA